MPNDLLNGIRPDALLSGGQQPSPSFPSGAPGGAASAPSDAGMSGREKFERVLRTAIPLIAAALGSRGSGAGVSGFAQGWGGVEQDRVSNLDRIAQHRERVESRKQQDADRLYQRSRQARQDYEQSQRLEQELRAEAERKQAAEDDLKRPIVQKAIETAVLHYRNDKDPKHDFWDKVQEHPDGAEAYKLQIEGFPGGGINLAEGMRLLRIPFGPDGRPAFDVAPPPGKKKVPYRVDTGEATYESLVDEDDPKLSVPHVVSRPSPNEPPKQTTRAYTWKDEDMDSPTFAQSFRIIEDEQGNILKRTPLGLGSQDRPPEDSEDNDPGELRPFLK